jgi:hypothetical protein
MSGSVKSWTFLAAGGALWLCMCMCTTSCHGRGAGAEPRHGLLPACTPLPTPHQPPRPPCLHHAPPPKDPAVARHGPRGRRPVIGPAVRAEAHAGPVRPFGPRSTRPSVRPIGPRNARPSVRPRRTPGRSGPRGPTNRPVGPFRRRSVRPSGRSGRSVGRAEMPNHGPSGVGPVRPAGRSVGRRGPSRPVGRSGQAGRSVRPRAARPGRAATDEEVVVEDGHEHDLGCGRGPRGWRSPEGTGPHGKLAGRQCQSRKKLLQALG